nr:hypothetical protein [Oscillospiraceae bacterium]
YVYPSYGLAIPGFQAKVTSDPSLAPFWRGVRFTGPYTAENAAEVPIVGSSNSVDIQITVEDGTEVMHMSCGLDYISSENLPQLDPDAEITVSGQAKWFRSASSRTLTYTIPEHCAIAVYDSSLNPVANTHVNGTDTVKIPANAYVAFIGDGTFVKH